MHVQVKAFIYYTVQKQCDDDDEEVVNDRHTYKVVKSKRRLWTSDEYYFLVNGL